MTSIVGIRCSDGVVIAADSSATFGNGNRVPTIEQPTDRKIEIVGDKIIIAGTGYVGHHQRFVGLVKKLWMEKKFNGLDELGFAKILSRSGLQEFNATHVQQLEYSALVAYEAGKQPVLCEFPGGPMNATGPTAFQPEIKDPEDHLWFVSAGSGQTITDPFLALFREVFWKNGPPILQGGIFTALWALQHACDVNPGGIKEPIRLAILSSKRGQYSAARLTENDLAEAKNMVDDATRHFASFRNILLGEDVPCAPEPPKKPSS